MFTLRRDIVVYNLPSFPIPPKSSPLPSYNLPSFRIPLKSSPLPRRLRSDCKHACETVTEKNDDADINNGEDITLEGCRHRMFTLRRDIVVYNLPSFRVPSQSLMLSRITALAPTRSGVVTIALVFGGVRGCNDGTSLTLVLRLPSQLLQLVR